MAKKPELVSGPRRNSYHGLEDAGQTFAYKDILTIDATGEIREAANSDSVVLGQAQAAAAGVVSTAVVADEWFDGDIIAIDCYNSSDAAVYAASNFIPGDKYSIQLVSGEWYADFLNTVGISDALVFIKAYGDLRDTLVGNTIYRGLFRIADGIAVNTAGL